MKKALLTITAAAIVAMAGSCGKESDKPTPEPKPEVTSLAISPTSLSLQEGGKATLKATMEVSDDKTDFKIEWESSDSGIASVKDGTVYAIKKGKATITATAGDKKAECQITVVARHIPIEGISLNSADTSLKRGNTLALHYTITPENATDKTVKWKSSDGSIVSVNPEGIIQAKKEGTADITVTAADGVHQAVCKVTVTPNLKLVLWRNGKAEDLPDKVTFTFTTLSLHQVVLFDKVDNGAWNGAQKDELKIVSSDPKIVPVEIGETNGNLVFNIGCRGEGIANVTFFYKETELGQIEITSVRRNFIAYRKTNYKDIEADAEGIYFNKVGGNKTVCISVTDKSTEPVFAVTTGGISMPEQDIPVGSFTQNAVNKDQKISSDGIFYKNRTKDSSDQETLSSQKMTISKDGDIYTIDYSSTNVVFFYRGKVKVKPAMLQ